MPINKGFNMLFLDSASLVTMLQQYYPNLLAVYLFGSYAQGTADKHSDVDLAVLIDGAVDPVNLWQTAQHLACQLNCDVDLVNLRTASTVLQYQIVTTGVLLWENNAAGRLYECFIYNEKLALDTRRAGILSDIKVRGSVYGR
jgi:predicted nucleotidyltransferase